jgi:uncharacterized Fe-S cluster-containing radical SAM superfamily protein
VSRISGQGKNKNEKGRSNKNNGSVQQKLMSFDPDSDLNEKQITHRIKCYPGTNPFELAEVLRKKVCRDGERKYYRFRGGRFYGGIAAADCVGCILDCVFCWSYKPRCNPESAGKFYTAKHVVEKLMAIVEKNGYDKIRISGNEPTLCKSHLLKVLEYVPENILFILETNGLLLDQDYVRALATFKSHLHARVSLKGVTPEQFQSVTAMDGEYLEYQFNALKYLSAAGISCNAAIMEELIDSENLKFLVTKLTEIDVSLAQNLEVESLIMYPFITTELARRGLNKSFKPE